MRRDEGGDPRPGRVGFDGRGSYSWQIPFGDGGIAAAERAELRRLRIAGLGQELIITLRAADISTGRSSKSDGISYVGPVLMDERDWDAGTLFGFRWLDAGAGGMDY